MTNSIIMICANVLLIAVSLMLIIILFRDGLKEGTPVYRLLIKNLLYAIPIIVGILLNVGLGKWNETYQDESLKAMVDVRGTKFNENGKIALEKLKIFPGDFQNILSLYSRYAEGTLTKQNIAEVQTDPFSAFERLILKGKTKRDIIAMDKVLRLRLSGFLSNGCRIQTERDLFDMLRRNGTRVHMVQEMEQNLKKNTDYINDVNSADKYYTESICLLNTISTSSGFDKDLLTDLIFTLKSNSANVKFGLAMIETDKDKKITLLKEADDAYTSIWSSLRETKFKRGYLINRLAVFGLFYSYTRDEVYKKNFLAFLSVFKDKVAKTEIRISKEDKLQVIKDLRYWEKSLYEASDIIREIPDWGSYINELEDMMLRSPAI